ncbi:hypothetical protein [Scandinavium goeteborgense]|uniref:Uncharacterized protein n=1 Tax=Scandinavium goeteborgense TaxID=1851514 RepID=A0A4R6EY76_SCAGO|nr:hypothetical protein [Scandinavium goeteborgense]TDN64272.1 hypothetical protein EC847_101197 [Scandinavium goeteborgense]
MKYFSTGFNVADEITMNEIFNECFSWVQESPHTTFIPAQLTCKLTGDDVSIESKNERIDIINHHNDSTENILGCFRYSKISEPHKWITDISVSKNSISNKTWIQVESAVISQEAAYLSSQPKKPLIVMKLIDRFSGGTDDRLKISIEPYLLSSSDDDFILAEKVINGETENRLPVIYISSKFFYHSHPHNVIPERLARKVSGLAHVLVEPENKSFSNQLKNSTNSKNAYGGAIGIYWPKGQSISYYRREDKSAKDFETQIFDDVLKATTTMAPVSDCGWSEIQNQKTRDSISTLKKRGEYTQELVKLYEEDNSNQTELIEDLKYKIYGLETRIRILQSQAPTQGSISLNVGDEIEFFNGEIKNIIIEALGSALINKHQGGRSHHILSSLVSNNELSNDTAERQQILKRTLTGYRSMDAKTLRQLKELGFDASEDGKHWKIIYNEDPRYTYILPKTGSDHRGSLNAISDISNIIF